MICWVEVLQGIDSHGEEEGCGNQIMKVAVVICMKGLNVKVRSKK